MDEDEATTDTLSVRFWCARCEIVDRTTIASEASGREEVLEEKEGSNEKAEKEKTKRKKGKEKKIKKQEKRKSEENTPSKTQDETKREDTSSTGKEACQFAVAVSIVGWEDNDVLCKRSTTTEGMRQLSSTDKEMRDASNANVIRILEDDGPSVLSHCALNTLDMTDLANAFLRVELMARRVDATDFESVASASVDLGIALVWQKQQINRKYPIRLRVRKNSTIELQSADMEISLSMSDGLLSSLKRARLFELQSGMCQNLPAQSAVSDDVRYAIRFDRFGTDESAVRRLEVIARTLSSSGEDSTSLEWAPRSYPEDLYPFGVAPVNMKAPPSFRGFVTDETAIALRRHLKDNDAVCEASIMRYRKRASSSDSDEREGGDSATDWEIDPTASRMTVGMNLSALLRPGVAMASCNASVTVEDTGSEDTDGDDAPSVFLSLRLSHPLLGKSDASDDRSIPTKLSVSQVFAMRKPRPKLLKVSAARGSVLASLRRDIDAITMSIAREYSKMSTPDMSSDVATRKGEREKVFTNSLRLDGKYDAIQRRLMPSVLRLVRHQLETATTTQARSEHARVLSAHLSDMIDSSVARIIGKDSDETKGNEVNPDKQLLMLALEAEAVGATNAAADHLRRCLEPSSSDTAAASVWEAYGAFYARRGLFEDALACFDEALELDFAASRAIRKAAVLANTKDFDNCARVLSNLKIDMSGQDDLTHDQGIVANALVAVCYDSRGNRIRRDAAVNAAAHRFLLRRDGDVLSEVAESQGTVVEIDTKTNRDGNDKDLFDLVTLSRKLPRTVSALGGRISRQFDHVKGSDVAYTLIHVSRWLHREGLFKTSSVVLSMLREKLNEKTDDLNCDSRALVIIDGHLKVLESRLRISFGNSEMSERTARSALDDCGGDRSVRRWAALAVAESMRAMHDDVSCSAKEAEYLNMYLKECRSDESVQIVVGDGDVTWQLETLRAQCRLAQLHLDSSKFEAARFVFQDIVRAYPTFVRAKAGLSRSFLGLGQLSEAEEIVCDANENDNHYPGAYGALALVALHRKPTDVTTAKQFIRMALRRNLRDTSMMRALLEALSKTSSSDSEKVAQAIRTQMAS